MRFPRLFLLSLLLVLPLSTARAVDLPGPLVTADWLAENLPADGLKVVDVRPSTAATAEGQSVQVYVPGAIAAPYNATAWRAKVDDVPGVLPPVEQISATIGGLGISNTNTVVIVPIGASATDFGAAARVYWTFRVLGHDQVAILDGGMKEWIAQGKPLAAAPAKVEEPVPFTATLNTSLLVSTDDVKSIVAGERPATLVDARPIAHFAGTSKSWVAERKGHIPGALHADQSLAWDQTTGQMNPPETLAWLYRQVPQEGEVVSYCNTGHWAATNWFVMSEVLGRSDVRLYDASIAGWSRDEQAPMVEGLPAN